MEQATKFFFIVLFGASWASYPYPNYRSIVTPRTVPSKPAVEYGVPSRRTSPLSQPEEVYGLPHVRTPSVVYGVPARTFDFDSDVVEAQPVKPSLTYGVPKPPSTSYGVPVQKVAVPRKPFVTYEVPSTRTFDFDLSGEEVDDDSDEVEAPSSIFVVPRPQKPSTEYGVPTARPVRPATVYGVPTSRPKVPATEYGVPTPRPKTPTTEYGVPPFKPAQPFTKYGVPQETSGYSFRPVAEYGLPKVKVPSVVYGVPPAKPSEEYGVPNVRTPATVYGLPY